jgi:hypothetical protein
MVTLSGDRWAEQIQRLVSLPMEPNFSLYGSVMIQTQSIDKKLRIDQGLDFMSKTENISMTWRHPYENFHHLSD